jgi:hypothetical protein
LPRRGRVRGDETGRDLGQRCIDLRDFPSVDDAAQKQCDDGFRTGHDVCRAVEPGAARRGLDLHLIAPRDEEAEKLGHRLGGGLRFRHLRAQGRGGEDRDRRQGNGGQSKAAACYHPLNL